MSSSRAPAFQFYTGDWRKDPCVQALDHSHKGVWIDLLCIMWDSVERGRLVLPTGKPMPDRAIARNLGITEAEWKRTRSTLLDYGVASEDDAGVLYNRRMVRDEAARLQKVQAGRKGGLSRKKVSTSEAKRGSSSSSSSSSSTSVGERESLPPEAHTIPADWEPKEQHRLVAYRERADVEREAEKFIGHAKANGKMQSDWDAAFSNWLRKVSEFRGSKGKTVTHDPENFGRDLDEEMERQGVTPHHD